VRRGGSLTFDRLRSDGITNPTGLVMQRVGRDIPIAPLRGAGVIGWLLGLLVAVGLRCPAELLLEAIGEILTGVEAHLKRNISDALFGCVDQ